MTKENEDVLDLDALHGLGQEQIQAIAQRANRLGLDKKQIQDVRMRPMFGGKICVTFRLSDHIAIK